MDKKELELIKEMLEDTIDKKLDNFRDSVKQELKPVKNQLDNLDKDIKEMKFDIRALKNATLEVSNDHLNHVHKVDDKKTSKPVQDIV